MSDAERMDDYVNLGQAADTPAMCRDTGNKDNKDYVSRSSKNVAVEAISATCRTKNKITKATTALSAIWYNEFKDWVRSARLPSPLFYGAVWHAAPSKQD